MADIELVIKISEELYQMCRSCRGDADCIESAIANGTPIPDNATNGDVMKIIFPKIGLYDEWYDAPYQKVR